MDKTSISGSTARHVATRTPVGFLAFGFGSGLAPKAPGTVGTLMGMLVGLPLAGVPLWAGLVIVALAFLAGIPICQKASTALGVHDHSGIVWDEFVGIWLVLVLVPFEPAWWLAAFLAFRLFDVVKPWPIGWLDRKVDGGFGIMLDDLIAALYAAAVLIAIRNLLPPGG
ncbi:MAG: phosphatidylglycerophosphatase A [Xanthomonadaceae bacterium]|nr:phosphatidylglycerophosphatase A [Xanthomonadaceae bacterium]